jgi:hypothetical protein
MTINNMTDLYTYLRAGPTGCRIPERLLPFYDLRMMRTDIGKAVEHKHFPKRTVRFAASNCFFCSAPLRSKGSSEDHVFPKWLQNRFKLWNQRLDLINTTSMPYRQLAIPCCKACNGVHLEKLEKIMQSAFESGPVGRCKIATGHRLHMA